MRTGENGRKAISWKQTEIDGLEAAPLDFLAIGAAWSWRGQARSLVDCDERSEIDSRGQGRDEVSAVASGQLTDGHFMQIVLTNGAQSHVATLLEEDDSSQPTLIFDGAIGLHLHFTERALGRLRPNRHRVDRAVVGALDLEGDALEHHL